MSEAHSNNPPPEAHAQPAQRKPAQQGDSQPTATEGSPGHAPDAPTDFTPRPGLLGILDRAGLLTIKAIVYTYRFTLSPFIGGQCRFYPTCSQYMLDAIQRHGPWRGACHGAWRVLRCNPFCKGGFDPA